MPASVERSQVLRFGAFEMDQRSRELRKQGVRLRLQEQPFQVLSLILERAGEVVTREDFRQKLWPSSVFVDFDHGLNNAIARLRETLGDSAGTPRFIETIPRVGYRFVCPVSIEVPTDAVAAGGAATVEVSAARGKPRVALIAASILLAIIVPGVIFTRWLSWPAPLHSPADAVATKEASIAVLPFVSIGSDPENERFADGLSDELLGKLARIPGLKLAGETSSFYFKGKPERPDVIAQSLHVNYLVEGTVRREAKRVRVTAELIDAATSERLWAQQFDREMNDIFQIQEDIALAVASAMPVKLLVADEQRLRQRGTQDAEAYRLYVMGVAQLKGMSAKQDPEAARRLFEQAIARDPKFAAAHAGLAHYYFGRAWGRLVDVEDGVQLGRAAAEHAVALDPQSSEALQARANFGMWQYRATGRFDAYLAAQEDYRRAIELDPWDHYIFFDYGRTFLWHEPALAQTLFDRAAALDPLARVAQGMSATVLSLYGSQQAADALVQALRHPPPDRRLTMIAASFDYELGRLDEAATLLRGAQAADYVGNSLQLWALYMSLGDQAAARQALHDAGDSPLSGIMGAAATYAMDGRYREAYDFLEQHRTDFPTSHVLDLPLARIALIAGKPERARTILEQQLPDLILGVEPVQPANLIPALDLVAAWNAAGKQTQARAMLERVATFLDGRTAPQWPLFIYQRARAYALAGKPQQAQQALDHAYTAGFRMTWALDLSPQPFLYVDSLEADPALATLRGTSGYRNWLARIRADNARQLWQLKNHQERNPG